MNKTIKFTSRKITKLEYIALNIYHLVTSMQVTLGWILYLLGLNIIMLAFDIGVIMHLLATAVSVCVMALLILGKIAYYSFQKTEHSQSEVSVSIEQIEIAGYFGKNFINYNAIINIKTIRNFLFIKLIPSNSTIFLAVQDASQLSEIKELLASKISSNKSSTSLFAFFNVIATLCLLFIIILSSFTGNNSAQKSTNDYVTYTPTPSATPEPLVASGVNYQKLDLPDFSMYLPSKVGAYALDYRIIGQTQVQAYTGTDENLKSAYSHSEQPLFYDVVLLISNRDIIKLSVTNINDLLNAGPDVDIDPIATYLDRSLAQATCETSELVRLTSGVYKREIGFCDLPQGQTVTSTAFQYIKQINDDIYIVLFYYPNDYFDREMFEKFVLINIKPAL